MTARTVFAIAASCIFGILAFWYSTPGVSLVEVSDYDTGAISRELAGPETELAITHAVRTVSIPLGVLSLALVEWSAVAAAYRRGEAQRSAARQSGREPAGTDDGEPADVISESDAAPQPATGPDGPG